MRDPATTWVRNRERVSGIGAATSGIFTFVKRRPRLRAVGMAMLIGFSRAYSRVAHPFARKQDQYRVVPSSEEWAAETPQARFVSVLSEERSINPLPKSVQGIVDWEYHQIADLKIPAPFVVEIENGHAVGDHGVVVGPDGALLHDVSLAVGGLRSFIWGSHGFLPDEPELGRDWALPARRLRGNAAVLSSYVGRGYFHWLFDVLPRVELLREAGYSVDDFDHFVLPGNFARFQVETLTALGIPRSKVVSSLVNRHVIADQLVVPSLTRQTGVVPQWVCDFLRETFQPEEPSHVEFGKRLYLGRKITDHGFVSDENELVSWLSNHGFLALATENLTLAQKAFVLGQADVVVSPEGGGLSNIVFGKPGGVAIELRVRKLPAMDFHVIANRVGMNFYDVYGDNYCRDDRHPTASQGPVGVEHVRQTFDLARISY